MSYIITAMGWKGGMKMVTTTTTTTYHRHRGKANRSQALYYVPQSALRAGWATVARFCKMALRTRLTPLPKYDFTPQQALLFLNNSRAKDCDIHKYFREVT